MVLSFCKQIIRECKCSVPKIIYFMLKQYAQLLISGIPTIKVSSKITKTDQV